MRLKAEFTKARVRRKCASVDQLKTAVLREKREANGGSQYIYPRWVRVNNIHSTLEDQLCTTFSSYKHVNTLAELAPGDEDRSDRKLLYVDPNIPDLVAVPYGADFTSSAAYKDGEIILQDKASCFPAYLLLGHCGPNDPWKGDLVDGCAAPGNKTTHMASLLAKQRKDKEPHKQIFSMDASKLRSKTLQKMVTLAGADSFVNIIPGQDFLALDPTDPQFENVSGLLLDPSCSGSGIVGRDDVPQLKLPMPKGATNPKPQGKKRKRHAHGTRESDQMQSLASMVESLSDENDVPIGAVDDDRLTKLSNLQARIVEHALTFPNATHVTYSTCSVHLIENEAVVARVLASDAAQQRGWRLLRRGEQPDGLQNWKHRGVRRDRDSGADGTSQVVESVSSLTEADLDACLRCWSGDAEGLGGFFVAGFVREAQHDTAVKAKPVSEILEEGDDIHDDYEGEWEGFSD